MKAAKTCFPNYLLHISRTSKIPSCVSKLFAYEMIGFNVFLGQLFIEGITGLCTYFENIIALNSIDFFFFFK